MGVEMGMGMGIRGELGWGGLGGMRKGGVPVGLAIMAIIIIIGCCWRGLGMVAIEGTTDRMIFGI